MRVEVFPMREHHHPGDCAVAEVHLVDAVVERDQLRVRRQLGRKGERRQTDRE
ncbi:MAG: hypothetical protein M3Y69_00215 [Verrucomicrobiota bacterium]|nr:hypothetical protein [Verrucomicrobiota bacterium]